MNFSVDMFVLSFIQIYCYIYTSYLIFRIINLSITNLLVSLFCTFNTLSFIHLFTSLYSSNLFLLSVSGNVCNKISLIAMEAIVHLAGAFLATCNKTVKGEGDKHFGESGGAGKRGKEERQKRNYILYLRLYQESGCMSVCVCL